MSNLKPVYNCIRSYPDPLGSLINIVTSRAINKDRETQEILESPKKITGPRITPLRLLCDFSSPAIFYFFLVEKPKPVYEIINFPGGGLQQLTITTA